LYTLLQMPYGQIVIDSYALITHVWPYCSYAWDILHFHVSLFFTLLLSQQAFVILSQSGSAIFSHRCVKLYF
jgi:hypothetical protein